MGITVFLNVNGENTLAYTKGLDEISHGVVSIYPLPHMPVVKDLVSDPTCLYAQYASIKPWMQTRSAPNTRERV
ncbi:MAG: 2Fe-2S iron-sulfur cluster-binding protein [Paralcaligenes sp.]